MTECKGLWYRISKESYTTERGASLRIQMRLLKTDSCPGCVFCTPIWKILRMKGASTIDNLHLKKHGDKCKLVRRKQCPPTL